MKKIIFIILISIILAGCDKKNNDGLKQTPINIDNNITMEEFSELTHVELEPLENMILDDETDSFTDEELNDFSVQITSVFEDFSAEIFNFQNDNPSYQEKLLSFYADKEKYPRATTEFCYNIKDKFQNLGVCSEFKSLTISDISFSKTETQYNSLQMVATLKGVIAANLSTNEYEKDIYNTLYRAVLTYDDGWKVLNMELWQVFKGEVQITWQPTNYETISITGEYAFNWDINLE